MRGERGQVTLFVAVGLVLLLVVGIWFMITRAHTPTPASEDVNAAVLSTYLSSCVDTIFNEEITSFAARGGAPDGLTNFPHATIEDAGKPLQVIFGILPDANQLPPPDYPSWSVGLHNSTLSASTGHPFTFSGYFGDVTLPGVCSTSGTNRPGQPITCKSYPGNPPGTPGPATQSGLEQAIAQRVAGCAAKKAFEDAIGKDVTVGTPKVNLTFTAEATVLSLTYPITISGESSVRLSTFQRSYKARYLALAQFAHDLAVKETQDIQFDIGKDYASIPSYRQGFSITRKQDIGLSAVSGVPDADLINGQAKADLITIVDANSVLDGESLRFLFLVAHRPPMLDTLTDTQYAEAARGENPTINALDPDDGSVQVIICPVDNPTADSRCNGTAQVLAIDADGQRDWQELILH